MGILNDAKPTPPHVTPPAAPAAPTVTPPTVTAPPITPPPPMAFTAGTNIILEKLNAGREIMRMMQEQQQANLELAKQFTELGKTMGWSNRPQPPKG